MTNLQVTATSSLQANQITVDKATVIVEANASLSTACNLVLVTSAITTNGTVAIRGNLDLSDGGAANSICGTGQVGIRGCVYGTNGDLNTILGKCGSNRAAVCSQQLQGLNCPGPVKPDGTRQACDALVTPSPSCLALPVELALFTAVPTSHQDVLLRWETASEKNNKSFAVERSADGKTFRSIRTLAGAGTTQSRTNYEAVDEQPLPGISYYRLRQTDYDGTSTFSPVRTVKFEAERSFMDVYPSSTPQHWVVSSRRAAELATTDGAKVRVFDMLGRAQQVTSVPDAAQAGRWTLDMNALPTGVYIVRLATSAGTYSQRIVK
jgi:hypothetical protein